jgi:hypothetical protein
MAEHDLEWLKYLKTHCIQHIHTKWCLDTIKYNMVMGNKQSNKHI